MPIQLIAKNHAGKEKLEKYFGGIWNPEQFSVSDNGDHQWKVKIPQALTLDQWSVINNLGLD